MGRRQFSAMVLGIGLLVGRSGIIANDTGGIIPWSADSQRAALAIASEQCARYNKYPRITSVHAQPGDYIGFSCVWSPHVRP